MVNTVVDCRVWIHMKLDMVVQLVISIVHSNTPLYQHSNNTEHLNGLR
jgi:hypothetical protein